MLFAGSGHTFQEILAALDADKRLPHFPLAVAVHARVGLIQFAGKISRTSWAFFPALIRSSKRSTWWSAPTSTTLGLAHR